MLDVERRTALSQRVIELLAADSRVESATIFGSTADGAGDEFADIDIHLKLSGVSDRAFAEMVPDFLRSIGPCTIEGWGWTALPEHFVRTFYFADYPLFWHVDVWCESEDHIDGTDLKNAYHWPQIFKVWVGELARVLRGAERLDQIDGIHAKRLDVSSLPSDIKQRLAAYLDIMHARALDRGAPCEELYERCDALRSEYLGRGRAI